MLVLISHFTYIPSVNLQQICYDRGQPSPPCPLSPHTKRVGIRQRRRRASRLHHAALAFPQRARGLESDSRVHQCRVLLLHFIRRQYHLPRRHHQRSAWRCPVGNSRVRAGCVLRRPLYCRPPLRPTKVVQSHGPQVRGQAPRTRQRRHCRAHERPRSSRRRRLVDPPRQQPHRRVPRSLRPPKELDPGGHRGNRDGGR